MNQQWVSDMNEILSRLESDDPLVSLGRKIGAEKLYTVLDELGGPIGMTLYMPCAANYFSKLVTKAREQEIRNRYNGDNKSQLCIEYQMKPSRLQKVLIG